MSFYINLATKFLVIIIYCIIVCKSLSNFSHTRKRELERVEREERESICEFPKADDKLRKI